jgi:hypothetical protein
VGHGTKCWRDNCLSGFGTTRTRILKDMSLNDTALKDMSLKDETLKDKTLKDKA